MHSRYRAVDYIWIGLYLRQHSYKVICSNCHTHWIAAVVDCIVKAIFFCVVWQISAVLVSSVKKRWKKGECVCTSATSLLLSHSHRKSKMLAVLFITAFHINILLKGVFVLFIFFCRVCSLIEQSIAWYLQWLLCSCQMHKLFQSFKYTILCFYEVIYTQEHVRAS